MQGVIKHIWQCKWVIKQCHDVQRTSNDVISSNKMFDDPVHSICLTKKVWQCKSTYRIIVSSWEVQESSKDRGYNAMHHITQSQCICPALLSLTTFQCFQWKSTDPSPLPPCSRWFTLLPPYLAHVFHLPWRKGEGDGSREGRAGGRPDVHWGGEGAWVIYQQKEIHNFTSSK